MMFVRLSILILSILHLSNSENQHYRIPPQDISGLIGSNVTIPCVLSVPHGDVQWTKDGLALGYERNLPAFPSWSIVGNEQLGEFNFFIESLKIDDEGLYACEVSPYQDAMALKQIAHIRTLVPPRSVRINHDEKVFSIPFDEQISQIECQVDGARPAAHIKWLNESGQEYPASSRVFSQSNQLFSTISTLTFVPSMSFNRKHFTCQVQHETLIDNLQASIEIEIISPPDHPQVTIHSSTNRLINGSYVTLSCRSYRGQPLGNLTWYRMNSLTNSSIEIREKDFVESNISIVVQPSDNNQTYSCQVNNDYLESIGEIRQTNLTLTVDFGPSFVQIQNKNGNETILIDGQPQRFLCRSSSSNPGAILTWKLDNEIIFPDIDSIEEQGEYAGKISQSTKTIGVNRSLRNYHKKILSCQATNPRTGETIIDSTLLNVIIDAIDMQMRGISSNQTIQVGEKIIAECILYGGNPLGKILWYKGNELLASNSFVDVNGSHLLSRVEFLANESDHNLPLTCKGQVEQFSEKIISVLLNITFLPEKILIVDDSLLTNLSLGHQYSDVLECRTSPSNPPLQLTIYRQTKSGEKHFDIQYRTSTIYIDQINSVQFMLPSIDLSFHENLLICEVVLDIDQTRLIRSVNSTIYVNHKPYFEQSNSSYQLTENQSFEITLIAHAYPSSIVYTWFHPSGRQLMNDQMNIFIEENHLLLKNLQRSDRGIYQCIATNSIGSTEFNFTLEILYGPIITRTQGYTLSEAIAPGSTARLLCVIDANPFDLNNIRWFKDNQEIVLDQWERRIEGKEVSLIRQSIEPTDTGEYLCEVENPFGMTRATIPLFVQYPPIIEKNQNKLAVDSHRFLSAEFHCLISSLPKPTITWSKDNQVLPMSSKYHSVLNDRVSSTVGTLLFHSVLIVVNISKDDYGIYQCKAENPLGFDLFDITLTGITSPDPPKDIQILNVSYSSIIISWQPAFNGGANQTFQLRYRLSTVPTYFYEYLPNNSLTFDLKNLRSNSEYHLNIRSNNSYHMSPWSDQITIKTSNSLPRLTFHLTELTSRKLPLNILSTIILIGLALVLINILFAVCFLLIQRRKKNLNNENLSTTDTNETETNTIDLFQPVATNSYQKYDDDDEIEKPFVSSIHLTPCEDFRLHQYYPINFENNHVTYRSFKIDLQNPIETHQCIRAELV